MSNEITNPAVEATQAAAQQLTINTNTSLLGVKPTVEEVKAMLQQAVDAALASPLFTGNVKLIHKALEALAIPDPYARFRRQFKDVATRNLLAKAPVTDGHVAYPTAEAIAAEIERLIDELKIKHSKAA